MFGLWLHGWETVLIVSATVAAAAAIGVGWATYAVITLTREDNLASSTELEKYKLDAELKTAEAARIAAQANERAAELERQTEALKLEAERAKESAALANKQILEMKTIRRLEKPQAEALSIILKSEYFQSKPQVSLQVASVADAEAQMFAMELMTFFSSCGVNIYPTNGGLPNECAQLAPNANGLVMTVKSMAITTAIQPFARFQRAADLVGLKFDVEENPRLRENEAVLNVLMKPTSAVEFIPPKTRA